MVHNTISRSRKYTYARRGKYTLYVYVNKYIYMSVTDLADFRPKPRLDSAAVIYMCIR